MTAYQNVFQRYEKKYILTPQQYEAFRSALTGRLAEDQYGKHTICNLYFDTDSYEMIRTSLDKPTYKEKLRLRSYGIPDINSPVYVEIKKKSNGIVYKRREQMTLAEAYRYLLAGIRPENETQILREIDYMLQRKHPQPRAFIAYNRIALAGVEDSELRVTFDTNLRWRGDRLDLTLGADGEHIAAPDSILMELKIADAMPLWLSRVLSELKIFPASFSKYGTCYRDHIAASETFAAAAAMTPDTKQTLVKNGGIICA